MRNKRDIILITGRNMVGKTTALYNILAYIDSEIIDTNIITDSQFLRAAVEKDDREGGFNHTHNWCTNSKKGHKHESGESSFPFTVLNNFIPDATLISFFIRLKELPYTGKIYFAELAGGLNILPRDEPGSQIDYSYAKIKRMFLEHHIEQEWLERIRAVIHLSADDNTRMSLKDKRLMYFSEKTAKSTASWFIDERVLQFYGHDDFVEIEDLFVNAAIPICNITNDGTDLFFDELQRFAEEIF